MDDGPFTEITAYFFYHDHDGQRTFTWDGESDHIQVHSGGLVDPHMDLIPLQGSIYEPNEAHGWLVWFQMVCDSYIRMEQADGQAVHSGDHADRRVPTRSSGGQGIQQQLDVQEGHRGADEPPGHARGTDD